jgi:hypothetical protein
MALAVKTDWQDLSHLQIGRYAEYLVKMEFALHGMDIYGSEVDDKGIDFVVVQREGVPAPRYYDVQVKSIRGHGYIFFPKDKFDLRDNLLAALALFSANASPDLYLIPSTAWRQPNALLRDHDFGEGKKSKPEWGLNLSAKNRSLLEQYGFEGQVERLKGAM